MAEPLPAVTLREFLEAVPPGRVANLDKTSLTKQYSSSSLPGPHPRPHTLLVLPRLNLYCGHSACERLQVFESGSEQERLEPDVFLHYRCRNCGETLKTYALSLDFEDGPDPKRGTDLTTVKVLKYGEVPQFGPPLPAKLLQLAGANGDLLKKGRQSENQGLGIGAFAYYRRVVELQKSRLIDEISNAVRRLGKNPESLAALEAARSEPNFSKALDLMVGVIPKELYINSQNPLKLLHGPLSAGIHGKSDEECLTQAHSVRVVLGALLARIQMVTQDEEELDAAIKDLLSPPEQEIDSSVK